MTPTYMHTHLCGYLGMHCRYHIVLKLQRCHCLCPFLDSFSLDCGAVSAPWSLLGKQNCAFPGKPCFIPQGCVLPGQHDLYATDLWTGKQTKLDPTHGAAPSAALQVGFPLFSCEFQ